MNDVIQDKLKTLPDKPGSYQMLDKDGRIIYVGKAKNLKNRVRSYFIGAHNEKTTALVLKIADFTYIVTKNETEAFLLEISLIKEYSPFYNIDLTDDKTYPYLEFTNEKNPKLIITRHLSKNNNRFFGPYPNVISARKTLDLINRLYKIRKCKTLPSRPCIYYEINECSAPCIHKITKEEYQKMYEEIRTFLNGSDHTILNNLKREMAEDSEKMDFENAKKKRDDIQAILDTVTKENVILKDKTSGDFYGICFDDSIVSISTLLVRNGKIILSKSDVFYYYFDLDDAIFTYIQNYVNNNLVPSNLYINEKYFSLLSNLSGEIQVISPKRGAKHQLLVMAEDNATTQLMNKTKIQVDRRRKALEDLGTLLNIPTPYRIESFDNSNLFGDTPVSSCIVYVDGKKSPKEYRKYKVQTVVGANDFATMKEVVNRRYQRLVKENGKLPDLILVDGGKIQIEAAKEAISSIPVQIKIAGLKKDDFHDTSTIIYEGEEFTLDKHSELYRLLFEIQEEVHRFAINFHRDLKEKNSFTSILDTIVGVGPILKVRLLEKYKTTTMINSASDEELKALGLSSDSIKDLRKKLKGETDFE